VARTCVLVPGDGIGPEVCDAVVRVLDAAGAGITWERRQAGVAALEAGDSEVLPAATCDAIRRHGVALKGPCTTPIGEGFSSVNVALRKALVLYAAVRPVRNLPGVASRFERVDLVIVRENTEGLYSGIENVITEGVVTSLKVVTERACRRIARFALDYAKSRGRQRVTAFHDPVIVFTTGVLYHPRDTAWPYPLEQLLLYALVLGLSLAAARLSWLVLEGPALRLGRRFRYA